MLGYFYIYIFKCMDIYTIQCTNMLKYPYMLKSLILMIVHSISSHISSPKGENEVTVGQKNPSTKRLVSSRHTCTVYLLYIKFLGLSHIYIRHLVLYHIYSVIIRIYKEFLNKGTFTVLFYSLFFYLET